MTEILQMYDHSLKKIQRTVNYSQFVNYLQDQTAAAGHRYAPSNYDIYMSEWEQEVLSLNVFQNDMGAWLHGLDSSHRPSSFC